MPTWTDGPIADCAQIGSVRSARLRVSVFRAIARKLAFVFRNILRIIAVDGFRTFIRGLMRQLLRAFCVFNSAYNSLIIERRRK